ncbi:MAG: YeeE/YedE family protein [Bdellovibrio sp.]
MTIVNFTPLPALYGGLLIGLASAILLLGNGRIFGISGIIGGILSPKSGETFWRILIIIGLIIGAWAASTILGTPRMVETREPIWLVIGGFFMGFGSRLGSGCTSGHGVCGISRFSVRSILATLTFMGTGIITVFLMNFFGISY